VLNGANFDGSEFKSQKDKDYGYNAIGMYHGIMSAHMLMDQYAKDNNIQYDLVVRARLDFIFEDFIFPNDFLIGDKISNDTIYLIKDRYATRSKIETNDKYFAGSKSVMDKFCNLYNDITKLYELNVKVEGQTLMENYIKMCDLKVKWVGHEHTYYKCVGRHRRLNLKKNYIVNKINNVKLFNLANMLLNKGYNVYGLNIGTDDNINILRSYDRFYEITDVNIGCDYIITDEIIDTNSILCYFGKKEQSKDLVIDLMDTNIYGENDNDVKSTDGIFADELSEFVVNLLESKSTGLFKINESKILTDIDGPEKMIFRYLDRGYYHCKVLKKENELSYFIDSGDLNIKKTIRKNFKIKNLKKYFNNNVMPSNFTEDFKTRKITKWLKHIKSL
jgi:hypothetical protein